MCGEFFLLSGGIKYKHPPPTQNGGGLKVSNLHLLCFCIHRQKVSPSKNNGEKGTIKGDHGKASAVGHMENGEWVLWVYTWAVSICQGTCSPGKRRRTLYSFTELFLWKNLPKVELRTLCAISLMDYTFVLKALISGLQTQTVIIPVRRFIDNSLRLSSNEPYQMFGTKKTRPCGDLLLPQDHAEKYTRELNCSKMDTGQSGITLYRKRNSRYFFLTCKCPNVSSFDFILCSVSDGCYWSCTFHLWIFKHIEELYQTFCCVTCPFLHWCLISIKTAPGFQITKQAVFFLFYPSIHWH